MIKVYEDKWIEILEWGDYAKTHKMRKFTVHSKCSDDTIGYVQYDTGWRRYIYAPIHYYKTIYSDRCEFSIGYFIFCMNRKRGCKSDFTKELIKILDNEFGTNLLNTAFQNKKR